METSLTRLAGYLQVPLWQRPEQHNAPSAGSQQRRPFRTQVQMPPLHRPEQHALSPWQSSPGTLQLTIGMPDVPAFADTPATVTPAAPRPSSARTVARRDVLAATARLSDANRS